MAEPEPKPDVTVRVKGYMEGSNDIEIVDMRLLSLGAVVVYDNHREFDVYFNRESFDVVHPEIWPGDDGSPGGYLFPKAMEGAGLGLLQGVGRAPPVTGFDDALEYAQQHLRPKDEANKWVKVAIPME